MTQTARMPDEPLREVEDWYTRRLGDLRVLGFSKEREILARAFRAEQRDPEPDWTTSRAATPDETRHASHVYDPMCLFCVLQGDGA